MLNKTNKTGNMLAGAAVMIAVAAMLLTAGAVQAAGIQSEHDSWFGGWADIGQPGNADEPDTGHGGGAMGGVDYRYQIAKHAVSVNNWQEMPNYNNIGGAGEWIGDEPTGSITMYQASAYANWLTSGDPDEGLYDIDWDGAAGDSNAGGWTANPAARDSSEMETMIDQYGIVYALPTEDEWYKAAYYSLEESSVGSEQYYLYADGSDDEPTAGDSADDEWNFDNVLGGEVRDVGRYGMEQNDTRNMMGNVYEWMEDPGGILRGGQAQSQANRLSSTRRGVTNPENHNIRYGFRVVAIPEPSSLVLLGLAGLLLIKRRRV